MLKNLSACATPVQLVAFDFIGTGSDFFFFFFFLRWKEVNISKNHKYVLYFMLFLSCNSKIHANKAVIYKKISEYSPEFIFQQDHFLLV